MGEPELLLRLPLKSGRSLTPSLLGYKTTSPLFKASSQASAVIRLVNLAALLVVAALCNLSCTHCLPLSTGRIIDSSEEAQSYDARQCAATLADSAALSAACIRAYLQEMSPTEVIPSDLVEVWRYLEKAPSVIKFMTRSAF